MISTAATLHSPSRFKAKTPPITKSRERVNFVNFTPFDDRK
ncbi:hypothetical protein U1707_09985 [Sphingomonas sp. PB2P12]